MIFQVSSAKQHLRKYMQHSVCIYYASGLQNKGTGTGLIKQQCINNEFKNRTKAYLVYIKEKELSKGYSINLSLNQCFVFNSGKHLWLIMNKDENHRIANRSLFPTSMVRLIYTFWSSLSITTSILERLLQLSQHFEILLDYLFSCHFTIISKRFDIVCYLK